MEAEHEHVVVLSEFSIPGSLNWIMKHLPMVAMMGNTLFNSPDSYFPFHIQLKQNER